MVKLFKADSWDKVKYLPKKFRGIIDLLRPFTLLAPTVGGICGALMAAGFNRFEGFEIVTLIYGVGTLILVTGASNALNQVVDAEIDEINKPYRPIPSGIVSKDEARTVAFFLYFFALFRATLLNPNFALLVLVIMCLTIIYSMDPIRLKKRLWLSNISIGICRGMLGFVAAWCIFGDITDKTPWVVGGIMFVYLIGATTTKDFPDVKGDKLYDVRTLPVAYGRNRSIALSTPFFILPFLFLPLGVMLDILRRETLVLTALVVWSIYTVYLLWKYAEQPDKKFENTPVWKHMYLMLMAMQIGFCAIYLMPTLNWLGLAGIFG